MSLLPLLFDDFYPSASVRIPAVHHRPVIPEETLPALQSLATLSNIVSQLANVDRDTSITFDKDKFQANIDVQQFKPEEITVKLTGENTITIEGKHEEKQDEHGFISRHFVRRYELPKDCDVRKLQSKLSSDGVLSITAPKKPEGKQVEYKEIPITRTGPVKQVEKKKSEGEEAKN